MKTALSIALVLLFALPAASSGQARPTVGDRVRVRHVDGRVFVGSIERADSVELTLGGPGGPYPIRVDDVERLERSLGQQRDFVRGMATTSTAVAGIVGLLVAASWSPCGGELCWVKRRRDAFAWGVMGGAFVGLPLGILVGAAVRTERWELLPFPQIGPFTRSAVGDPGRGAYLVAAIPLGP